MAAEDPDEGLEVQAAIGQRTRWRILRLLSSSEEGVEAGAIARDLEVSPSNLSMQLRVLSRAGLVTSSRVGKFVSYRLVRENLAAAGDALRGMAGS